MKPTRLTIQEKKDMMQKLTDLWTKEPEIRFLQLVSNVLQIKGVNTSERDIFYVDDDIIKKAVEIAT